MLHHVEIYVSDIKASYDFWSKLLAHIDYEVTDTWDVGFTLKCGTDAYLTFVAVEPKYSDMPYHRCAVGLNHLAFKVKGRDMVDTLQTYCRDNSITQLYADRYPFANGGKDYYALFIEDPDRIKVEFVAV